MTFNGDEMNITKGSLLKCIQSNDKGYAIYPGEIYVAESNPYQYNGMEVVELVLNGDGEPGTIYNTYFFEMIGHETA